MSHDESRIKAENIPRCPMLDGSTLRIVPADTEAGRFREANCITVTDGERTAVYVAYKAIEPSKKTDAQPPLVADPDEVKGG
jgi:hypothetical protein